MITLITKNNCPNCSIIKNKLNELEIEFIEKNFDLLESPDRFQFIKIARKNKIISFPIIMDNNEVISLNDAIIKRGIYNV